VVLRVFFCGHSTAEGDAADDLMTKRSNSHKKHKKTQK
jgi:hypothetical protein